MFSGNPDSPVCTLRSLLTHHLNISEQIDEETLKALLPFITNPDEARDLLGDKEVFSKWTEMHEPRMADIFKLFPSLKLTTEQFVSMLTELRPRWYLFCNNEKI